MSTFTKILVYYYIIINLILFTAMGIDKYKAVKNKRRIPEATLFIMSLLGGAVGGLLGMYLFRHKTQKISFHIIYIIALILHISLIILLIRGF